MLRSYKAWSLFATAIEGPSLRFSSVLQTQSYSGGATVPLSHSMAFVTILMPSALIAALFVTYGLIEHMHYSVKKSLWSNIKYQCLGTVHSCQSETKPRKGLVHAGRRSSPDGCERTPARTRSWQNLGELVPFLLELRSGGCSSQVRIII